MVSPAQLVPHWNASDRLRKVRREFAQVGQTEFAEMIQVGRPTYAAWESGRHEPRARDLVSVAQRIETLIGIPATWVLGLDPGEPVSASEAAPKPAVVGAPSPEELGRLVAAEIRRCMDLKRISARQMSALLDVSHTFVTRRLNGETPFAINDLARFSAVLEVSTATVLSRAIEAGSEIAQGEQIEVATITDLPAAPNAEKSS